MTIPNKGDTVKIHYTGTLENGQVFDTSKEREPLEFKIGEGQVITGLEKGIMGMEVGETKDIEIAPNEAYGPYREELIMKVPSNKFPEHIKPEVGLMLKIRQQDGTPFGAVITDVAEEGVTLDANHPLAGQTLYFEVELLDISNPV